MGKLLGSGVIDTRMTQFTENSGTITGYTCEWLDLHVRVQTSTGVWILIKVTGLDLNNNYPHDASLAAVIYDAENMAKIFGQSCRIYDTRDGEMLHETCCYTKATAWRITKLKHDVGDHGHYSGEVEGYGHVSGVKSTFIWFKNKLTGLITDEYIQSQLKWDKQYDARYTLQSEIRRITAAGEHVEIIETDPFTIGVYTVRWNDTTTYPYSRRWEWLWGNEWLDAGPILCDLLDKLGNIPEHTYSEWRDLGNARYEKQFPR